MSNLAFDTHKFVTDLNKAGMDTAVAEVLANHYAGLLNDRIATKDDLALLKTELKTDMALLRTDLKNDVALLEERVNTRIIAAQLAGVIATCAILGSLIVYF